VTLFQQASAAACSSRVCGVYGVRQGKAYGLGPGSCHVPAGRQQLAKRHDCTRRRSDACLPYPLQPSKRHLPCWNPQDGTMQHQHAAPHLPGVQNPKTRYNTNKINNTNPHAAPFPPPPPTHTPARGPACACPPAPPPAPPAAPGGPPAPPAPWTPRPWSRHCPGGAPHQTAPPHAPGWGWGWVWVRVGV
jgi:hypothetical protein